MKNKAVGCFHAVFYWRMNSAARLCTELDLWTVPYHTMTMTKCMRGLHNFAPKPVVHTALTDTEGVTRCFWLTLPRVACYRLHRCLIMQFLRVVTDAPSSAGIGIGVTIDEVPLTLGPVAQFNIARYVCILLGKSRRAKEDDR